MTAVVPAIDEGLDRGDEVFDRGEAAAADRLAVMIEKKISTMFSHDPEVGVKCKVTPGVPGQPGPDIGVGVSAPALDDGRSMLLCLSRGLEWRVVFSFPLREMVT